MNKPQTYRQRTQELETVRLALENGYQPLWVNATNIRHFSFLHKSLPNVDVSWFRGSDHASVSVGDTTTTDYHAVEILAVKILRDYIR
jgi:hypothetical protein